MVTATIPQMGTVLYLSEIAFWVVVTVAAWALVIGLIFHGVLASLRRSIAQNRSVVIRLSRATVAGVVLVVGCPLYGLYLLGAALVRHGFPTRG